MPMMGTPTFKWTKLGILSALILVALSVLIEAAEKSSKKLKAEKIGKNIMDYSEADMHRLLDQWNDNDDEYDPEEDDDPRLPPKSPNVKIDPTLLQKDPQAFLRLSKKNKPLMMFVNVAGNPTRKKTEDISSFWQQSLHNAQYQLTRYIVADNRVLIHLQDGSKAWDVKDFLITQPDCEEVEFENQKFPGAGASKKSKTEL